MCLYKGFYNELSTGPANVEERRKEVADVESTVCGEKVQPEHIIGESIRRSTCEFDLTSDKSIVGLGKPRAKDKLFNPQVI